MATFLEDGDELLSFCGHASRQLVFVRQKSARGPMLALLVRERDEQGALQIVSRSVLSFDRTQWCVLAEAVADAGGAMGWRRPRRGER